MQSSQGPREAELLSCCCGADLLSCCCGAELLSCCCGASWGRSSELLLLGRPFEFVGLCRSMEDIVCVHMNFSGVHTDHGLDDSFSIRAKRLCLSSQLAFIGNLRGGNFGSSRAVVSKVRVRAIGRKGSASLGPLPRTRTRPSRRGRTGRGANPISPADQF